MIEPFYEIVTDGTPKGTRVLEIKTGKALEWVRDIDWHISVDEPYAIATVVLQNVAIRSYERESS